MVEMSYHTLHLPKHSLKSPARATSCVKNVFVPVYPAEQIVVVFTEARKLNLCCCSNGRVLQHSQNMGQIYTYCVQLERSHFAGQHTVPQLQNHSGLIKQSR